MVQRASEELGKIIRLDERGHEAKVTHCNAALRRKWARHNVPGNCRYTPVGKKFMIPESSGATPFGIFLLADEYLAASRASLVKTRHALTYGPTRLLAYHSCELFLKTYMRSHGMLIADLRTFQHDLPAMLAAATKMGLRPKKGMLKAFKVLEENNDYVRVRYSLKTDAVRVHAQNAIALAEKARESVRIALNFDEFGNPRGELWNCPLPADHPVSRAMIIAPDA
ncbi:hypothetical protein BTN45_10830 [Rhizobium sp. ZX09]|nr:hypothetical protein BTN45_10830 [Rhizobium sp. ZX09]